MNFFKKSLWVVFVFVMMFSFSIQTYAKSETQNITKKEIKKIVNDTGEYLTEIVTMGNDGEKFKFNAYTKTQIACRLSKLYPLDKEYSYQKKSDIKKNSKNLFGTSKLKFRKWGHGFYFDSCLKNKKIIVSTPGGNFRASGQKIKFKIKKIKGKNTKKVTIDCGWLDYYNQKTFYKGGTFILTLKPSNNKYGCIITNIKEKWRQPDNTFY